MNVTLEAEAKHWLVVSAVEIADKACEVSKGRTQVSQLRNLMAIAQAESEVPVLKNFIEYQAGRRATSPFWRPIHKKVIEILQEIDHRFEGKDATNTRQLAIQNFFGYMVRHYVYKMEMAKPDRQARRGGGR